jgi:hypothetical protein
LYIGCGLNPADVLLERQEGDGGGKRGAGDGGEDLVADGGCLGACLADEDEVGSGDPGPDESESLDNKVVAFVRDEAAGHEDERDVKREPEVEASGALIEEAGIEAGEIDAVVDDVDSGVGHVGLAEALADEVGN